MKLNCRWLANAILVLVSIVGASCGGTAAGEMKVTSSGFQCPTPENPLTVQSTELNLYVWTEYIPAEMIECFQLEYNIKVNRSEYSSNEEMVDRVKDGKSRYDLVQPTDYIVALMIRSQLLQKLDHTNLPALKNFDTNYINLSFDPGNQYTIPYLAGTDAIVVNTAKVKDIPQSWADLWNPEYAGRMVFTDDMRTVIGMTLLTLGFDVNTQNSSQLSAAREKLRQLIPNVKLFDSDSPKDALINGDADLGLIWTGEALLAKQQKPSIEYIYPAEGAILWQDNWAILRGAPHTDAAYAFLNYINQGNIFWLVLKEFPYTDPNNASLTYARYNQQEIYSAYFVSPITNTPFEALQKGHRITDVGDANALYENIWRELIDK